MPNFGPDLGPVHTGSGPDRSSEPDLRQPYVQGGVQLRSLPRSHQPPPHESVQYMQYNCASYGTLRKKKNCASQEKKPKQLRTPVAGCGMAITDKFKHVAHETDTNLNLFLLIDCQDTKPAEMEKLSVLAFLADKRQLSFATL